MDESHAIVIRSTSPYPVSSVPELRSTIVQRDRWWLRTRVALNHHQLLSPTLNILHRSTQSILLLYVDLDVAAATRWTPCEMILIHFPVPYSSKRPTTIWNSCASVDWTNQDMLYFWSTLSSGVNIIALLDLVQLYLWTTCHSAVLHWKMKGLLHIAKEKRGGGEPSELYGFTKQPWWTLVKWQNRRFIYSCDWVTTTKTVQHQHKRMLLVLCGAFIKAPLFLPRKIINKLSIQCRSLHNDRCWLASGLPTCPRSCHVQDGEQIITKKLSRGVCTRTTVAGRLEGRGLLGGALQLYLPRSLATGLVHDDSFSRPTTTGGKMYEALFHLVLLRLLRG